MGVPLPVQQPTRLGPLHLEAIEPFGPIPGLVPRNIRQHTTFDEDRFSIQTVDDRIAFAVPLDLEPGKRGLSSEVKGKRVNGVSAKSPPPLKRRRASPRGGGEGQRCVAGKRPITSVDSRRDNRRGPNGVPVPGLLALSRRRWPRAELRLPDAERRWLTVTLRSLSESPALSEISSRTRRHRALSESLIAEGIAMSMRAASPQKGQLASGVRDLRGLASA